MQVFNVEADMDLRNLFRNDDNVVEVAAGSILFSEGDPGDVMYVVLDGQIEVQIGGQSVDLVEPGDILGELALIDDEPRSATAIATKDARLVQVDERKFLFMVQQTPFFSLQVMRVLAARLRRRKAA